ncbi:MAG TPA: helix-turn-helix domain-containing protein [Micromonosporaceae bacterium]|nr:helix-turn-helix domain-containing protein [Micromonosporaceae bacterium]
MHSFEAGPLIRRLRQRTRISQRELAWRARLSHTTVSRAETGELAPSLSVLQRLLAVGALRLVVVDERGRVVPPLAERPLEPYRRVRRYAHKTWDRPAPG